MTGGVKQIPSVRRIDIKENTGYDDGLLLEELLEECQAIVYGGGQLLEIEPDVKGGLRRYVHVKVHLPQALEHMIAFHFEVPLECDLLYRNASGVKNWDGRELQWVISAAVQEGTGLRQRSN